MENASEKNFIIETNKINPHPGEEFVGVLIRKTEGLSKKWRPFVYAKKGIFLEEFRPDSNRLGDFPREIIDLTGLRVENDIVTSGLSKVEVQRAFKIIARNGKVLYLLAASVEEKTAWTKVLRDQETTNTITNTGFQATSNIAPVRRRQISIQDLKRNALKKVALVEANLKGIILRFNEVAEYIFGWKEVEIVGQSINKLMPESVQAKHDEYLSNYQKKAFGSGKMIGKYRKLEGMRKTGEHFQLQIHLELTSDGNILATMIEVNRVDLDVSEDPDEYKVIHNIRVRLIEGKGLAGEKASKKIEKFFDPYCVLLVDNERKATTSAKLGTTTPFWGEDYFFDDIGATSSMLKVIVNNQNKSQAKDPRHGQVVIDLKSLEEGKPTEKWYSIIPVKSDPEINLGTMRIKTTMITEKILPFKEYAELLELVLDDELIIFNALGSVAGSQLEEIAGTLVNIFAMENRVLEFIRNLTTQEIANTDSAYIIFRANSLTTKVIDIYMKMVGMDFLRSVISNLVIEVYDEKESCEIDPTRLEKGADLQENLQRLLIYTNRFFGAIASSVDRLPPQLGFIFDGIRSEVSKKWPNSEVEKCTSVSGFIFLRFFCPAILDPNLFGLMEEHPTGNTARTLTLIAKTLQSLSNLVELGIDKEVFMEKMNVFIKENLDRMKSVIGKFSRNTTKDPNKFEKFDQRNLRRELSALFRYFSEKREIIRENLKQRQDLDNPKFSRLFSVIEYLDERHQMFEMKKSESKGSLKNLHQSSNSLTQLS